MLYRALRSEFGFVPDHYTFPFLLKACFVPLGLVIHGEVIKMGFCFDVFVCTGLVDLYSKVGEVEKAQLLFDEMPVRSPATWTAMLLGYAKLGDEDAAAGLFELMPEKDTAAHNAMIDVFAKAGKMDLARKLFGELSARNVVSWTSLLSGYCKNRDLDAARSLFDAMPTRNLFSWNVMIGGYCQNKQPHRALELFQDLQFHPLLSPDKVTLVSIIPAIADLGALNIGRWIHQFARRSGLDKNGSVCTALVDMYAKCGDVENAKKVFFGSSEREVASWNAMINGLAVNGCSEEALEIFKDMISEGAEPNSITMIGVLSACSHGGLVGEGRFWFRDMRKYGIEPAIEHFGCLIDLLGRAGLLEEAEGLAKRMPYEVNGIILSSLLFACGTHSDFKRGERIMKKAIEMEPWNLGNYVMARNMYAGERRWGDVANLKAKMRKLGTKKEVGCSVIEVECKVCEFVAGDRMHSDQEVIYEVLNYIGMHMGDQGEDDSFSMHVATG